MLRYRICHADEVADLEQLVNVAITEGWILSGGVSICALTYENYRKGYEETGFHYAQAMVKEMDRGAA